MDEINLYVGYPSYVNKICNRRKIHDPIILLNK